MTCIICLKRKLKKIFVLGSSFCRSAYCDPACTSRNIWEKWAHFLSSEVGLHYLSWLIMQTYWLDTELKDTWAHKLKPRQQLSQLLNLVTVHSFVCLGHTSVCVCDINSIHWYSCSKSEKREKKFAAFLALCKTCFKKCCGSNIGRILWLLKLDIFHKIFQYALFCSVNFSCSLVIDSMMAKPNVWAQLCWEKGAFFGLLLLFGREVYRGSRKKTSVSTCAIGGKIYSVAAEALLCKKCRGSQDSWHKFCPFLLLSHLLGEAQSLPPSAVEGGQVGSQAPSSSIHPRRWCWGSTVFCEMQWGFSASVWEWPGHYIWMLEKLLRSEKKPQIKKKK